MEEISDGKYGYVNMLIKIFVPESIIDEQGVTKPQSSVSQIFLNRKDNIRFPFSYDDYIANSDVIATLNGYEIDIEMFWYVVLFIYDITQEKCVNVTTLGKTVAYQARELVNILKEKRSFTISTEDKSKLDVDSRRIVQYIRDCLKVLISEHSDVLSQSPIRYPGIVNDLYSPSVQMWYASNLFVALFKVLQLPNKRAKEGVDINKAVSYSKMLLISRLMYFMGYTKNESFLSSDNSLKGILRQYAYFELNTYSATYNF